MNKTAVGLRVLNPLPTVSKLLLLVSVFCGAASAQVVLAPSNPQIGSSNPVSAEPLVTRPDTKPCIVSLLSNAPFASFNGAPLTYTPPADCPGPWAKVVLTADFTVSSGNQFDRSAWFYLGDVNIFYGTTAEPRSNLSPSWHVERDLTDLTSFFKTPQTGLASIGNIVNSVDTSTIFASAALEFYPVARFTPAPVVPDIIVPVSVGNGPATLNTTTDQVTQTLNLPRNVEKVYLDVFAQNQSNDEFYYLCVPNDQTGTLESCGNTAFRETEITIDGKPAGVAPVFPFIFTGGIDPFLWEPITGVQTLNFKPYRVDLTPYAGVLGDGSQHIVGISVFNANTLFLATANMLVFTDHGSKEVSGGLISNTLSAAPTPQVNENLTTSTSGVVTGTVAIGSNRSFTISGFVNTSHGRVETTVEQQVNFLSTQTFNVNPNTGGDVQNAVQTSTVDSKTTTRSGILVETESRHVSYPLTVNFSFIANANGTFTQATTANQQNLMTESKTLNGFPLFESNTQEQVNSNDTLQLNASENLTSAAGKSNASYQSNDSLGNCFSRSLTAENQVLTSVTDGKGCHERRF
ncbi:peptide-N4-asparagine amidase [Granulicella mallensis]|uniref:Peptide-N(4)-(N-acetyl-beta-glucosaminyl)asparagine amidase n=1 Tax=Granulicella mallensis (strain ATCC BAA-1857 / DSM 23137 / MP5ACTX8) TaxID=682795 RepID=G8NXF4_GRAMM|nr:peptide-N4-asparagine amidase [Granulicella mallensis]AEU37861.1 Peptide-N(4)-(N-acetyl-beta-glucosaminyl)asparagine amidase [Granulicella mallensis MP5ACTX8]